MLFVLPIVVFYLNSHKKNTINGDLSKQLQMSEEISVYFHNEDKVKKLPLDEYLFGVVSAEMPASFEYEALKAQSVAARSYALYKAKEKSQAHPTASVCTDSSHCKAYKTKDELLALWKENSEQFKAKIQNAVLETSGEVIKYNGDVAMAVFHSQAGGGRTESSEDVWGGSIPYLVSVESHGEEDAPGFYTKKEISFSQFKEIMKENFPSIKIESPSDIGAIEVSQGGSVKNIVIGGVGVKGKDLRRIFNLRSSCFKLSCENERAVFEVMGYGHGVGMSQYGANTLAKEGYNYKDILTHYYSGTVVEAV